MTYENILYEKRDGVVWITLNRPQKLNSVTVNTFRELYMAHEEAAQDPEVCAVVSTGAGFEPTRNGAPNSPCQHAGTHG